VMYEAANTASALMITEGVLMYLPAATVGALASESWTHGGIAHWVSDATTSAFTNALGGADTMRSLRHVQASDALKGEEILDLLCAHGWTTASRRSYITDVGFTRERARRMFGGGDPPVPPFPQNDPTGVYRFAHN